MDRRVPASLRNASRYKRPGKLPRRHHYRSMPKSKKMKSAPDSTALTRAEAIQLLGYFLSLGPPRWQNLQSFINVYITVDLTVLGAAIIGFNEFSSFPKNLVLLVAPVSAIVIARLAKETITRQERHVRESIVVTAHLEQIIGLPDTKPLGSSMWPDDTSIIPKRWMDSRLKHETSDEFINDPAHGGTANAAIQTFSWLQIVALIVAAAAIALPFM